MIPPSAWVDDDRPLFGFDPASAWCLGHGRAFVPMLLDRFEAPDDFGFVVATDAAYPQQGTGGIRPDPVLFAVSDLQGDGAAETALALLRQDHGMVEPVFHLLPLRRRMLVPPGDATPMPGGPGGHVLGSGSGSGFVRPPDGDPPKAIVGVIDHAINVFHERFRIGETSSRVAFAWDQGGTRQPLAGRVRFGRDWEGTDISGLLAKHGGNDAAALRDVGLADFVRPNDHPLGFLQSHGTGVLDVAAGADPHGEGATAPPILAVMLPSVVARESSGVLLPFFLIEAFEYLLARAREINTAWGLSGAQSIPLYVNASFGVSGGPRGEDHPIDRGIRGLLAAHDALQGGPVGVIFPAGNRNLAEGHARDEGRLEVDWRHQPGDRTSNYLDIWISGTGPVSLGLGAPGMGAPEMKTMQPGQPVLLMRRGMVIGRAVLEDGRGALRRLGIATAPTDSLDTGRVPAPAGAWSLVVETPEDVASEIHAWILRDDSPPGFSDGGRQSYFDDSAYRRYDGRGDVLADDPPGAGIERRQGTLNAMATGDVALVIGGFRLTESARHSAPPGAQRRRAVPAAYSAAPLEAGCPLGLAEAVTLSAVSDRSMVSSGVLCAATLSGGTLPLNGTSVAAPQVVRALAAEGVAPASAEAFLTGGIAYDPPPGLPGRRIGAGGIGADPRFVRR